MSGAVLKLGTEAAWPNQPLRKKKKVMRKESN